jgi:hypothetical protein
VDGQSYRTAKAVFRPVRSAHIARDGIDSVDVEGALVVGHGSTEADIQSGLFDGATVETLLVNWCEPNSSHCDPHRVVGKITPIDGRFVAELESVAASLDKPNGRYLRRAATRGWAMRDAG